MSHVITLIHGTFAKDSPWTHTESQFCNRIANQLGKDIIFHRFQWSGKNSHITRIIESEKLAQVLDEQHNQFPNKRKIIIAHSHGGNIAMYALKILQEKSENFELITMATPFLNSTIRPLRNLNIHIKSLSFFLMFLFNAVICTLIGLAGFFTQLSFPEQRNNILTYTCLSIILGFALGMAIEVRIAKYLKAKSTVLPKKLECLINKISIESLEYNYPILAIINHQDEVRRIFAFLSRIWELILDIHSLLAGLLKRALQLILILVISIVVLSIFNIDGVTYSNSMRSYVLMPVLISVFILGVLLPLLTLIIPCVFFLIKSNPFILGWESWVHQIFIRTTPALSPFGYRNFSLIQDNFKRKKYFSLKHSIYSNEKVVSIICDWLKKTNY